MSDASMDPFCLMYDLTSSFFFSSMSGRGTSIADKSTQLYLVEFNQDYLFNGGDEAWEDLIENVQPGWEDDSFDDDDDSRRRLTASTSSNPRLEFSSANDATPRLADFFQPKADRLNFSSSSTGSSHDNLLRSTLPFTMTSDMRRQLQNQQDAGQFLEGCDIDLYNEDLTHETRLWPIWKTKSKTDTAFNPDVIYEICNAEQETQAVLEKNGLCFGCEDGCLPPYSIVLYARLQVTDGLTMSCEELRDAWAPLQASTEEVWAQCVADVKESFVPNGDNELPESCPFGFATFMVDENFDSDELLQYTSSVFVTYSSYENVEEMFDLVDKFDRAGGPVKGAYDTQYEDFGSLFADASLNSDMILALTSAAIIGVAVVIHTKSLFITAIGLLQIVFSFPLAYFVYKLILGLDFFPFLNFIGVFVIFAIGADDIFVAIDKWKNARLKDPKATTETIAARALPDAAGAMFLTTITTAVAFFATAICPVAPVEMFAIFLGLLVIFDYLMNVFLVFPALVIYDQKLQSKKASWCIAFSCCKKNAQSEEPNLDHDVTSEEDDSPKKQNLIQRILSAYYNALHRARWVLMVVVAVALGLSSYYTSTLELPTSSDVRLISDSYQYEQNYLWRQNLLSDTLEKSSGSLAYVIWGVKPADTGTHSEFPKSLRCAIGFACIFIYPLI